MSPCGRTLVAHRGHYLAWSHTRWSVQARNQHHCWGHRNNVEESEKCHRRWVVKRLVWRWLSFIVRQRTDEDELPEQTTEDSDWNLVPLSAKVLQKWFSSQILQNHIIAGKLAHTQRHTLTRLNRHCSKLLRRCIRLCWRQKAWRRDYILYTLS